MRKYKPTVKETIATIFYVFLAFALMWLLATILLGAYMVIKY